MTISLYERYLAAKEQHSGKYAYDLAELLNVSEAELIWARVGHGARRLDVDAHTLIAALEEVGEVKAITRNHYAVHEHLGCYCNQRLQHHVGLILNPRELDLRLFLRRWHSVFSLSEVTRHGERHSIQFFDQHGIAVHKVYVTEQTDLSHWNKLIARFAVDDNPSLQLIEPSNDVKTPLVQVDKIDAEWRAMTNVHQFFQLLDRHQVTRQQAFNAVGQDLAYRVDNQALSLLFDAAKTQQNEIMIFVTNSACTQIFTGKIERVAMHNQWINIFNKRFTLHLIESAIAESWITRKPTEDGFVTSLELFAADGIQIAQLYGQRTEGQSEQTVWREQIAKLPRQEAVAA